ncbi:hypothetical protein DXG03_004220 [Asterophora parasitica]|uniref:Uncharacterized protein n=1 Tax=Asterophora parasitica TaxID=117018 RepID=A0A9P7GFR2_9AGAR|nr:hypothetical protein DXG03_004220 [Asterophora parasitica]
MRSSILIIGLGITATAQASSWFGSNEPAAPYSTWSATELKSWLQAHKIPTPPKSTSQAELKGLVEENWNSVSAWSYDQYASAQKSFADVGGDAFDQWDESRLRSFLLAQGIVAPEGPKEQLVHLAKSQYRAYTKAASSYSDRASTAAYGDSTHQATQSVSSLASEATNGASRDRDDTKDYVYSTWDDDKIRSYLASVGVQVKEEAKQNRNHLLTLMHDAYAKVTDPIYDAWSDSYLHDWLVSRKVISPTPSSPYSRDHLLKTMKQYYYDANDSVYSSWSDSQLKEWLVKQGIVKNDAEIKRDKMLKLVQDNYLSAKSTVSSAWSDSQLREWLIEHKYVDDRNAAQIKRDELVDLFAEKCVSSSSRRVQCQPNNPRPRYTATGSSYLAWPDARLRAYLRQNNISENKLPTSRPGLLQETRIRWVQTQSNTEALWVKIRDIVGSVEENVEERLGSVWNVLKAHYEQVNEKYDWGKRAAGEEYESGKDQTGEKYEHGKKYAGEAYDDAKGEAGRRYTDAEKEYEYEKERAYEEAQESSEKAKEKAKSTGQKAKGEL